MSIKGKLRAVAGTSSTRIDDDERTLAFVRVSDHAIVAAAIVDTFNRGLRSGEMAEAMISGLHVINHPNGPVITASELEERRRRSYQKAQFADPLLVIAPTGPSSPTHDNPWEDDLISPLPRVSVKPRNYSLDRPAPLPRRSLRERISASLRRIFA
jgi:hypothetical protein